MGLLVVSSVMGARPASADDKKDVKEAIALFEKGRRLIGDPETLNEACRLLEQSFKLAVRGDTLLNLAYCHERQGRTATAWREYDKAIAEGERVKYSGGIATAMKHRDALGEKLSTFTLEVSEETAKLGPCL
jgi:tetratricopeptide (TPR) repeat protein